MEKPVQSSYPFALRDICGNWVSYAGSPALYIYYTPRLGYRITVSYSSGYVCTCRLRQLWGGTLFYLWGFYKIKYDRDTDTLTLSIEGTYHRELCTELI